MKDALTFCAEHPGQDLLEAAVDNNATSEERDALIKHVHTVSRERGIDLVLDKYGVDVILGPADSPLNLLVCGAGTSKNNP
jgi:amidase